MADDQVAAAPKETVSQNDYDTFKGGMSEPDQSAVNSMYEDVMSEQGYKITVDKCSPAEFLQDA